MITFDYYSILYAKTVNIQHGDGMMNNNNNNL